MRRGVRQVDTRIGTHGAVGSFARRQTLDANRALGHGIRAFPAVPRVGEQIDARPITGHEASFARLHRCRDATAVCRIQQAGWPVVVGESEEDVAVDGLVFGDGKVRPAAPVHELCEVRAEDFDTAIGLDREEWRRKQSLSVGPICNSDRKEYRKSVVSELCSGRRFRREVDHANVEFEGIRVLPTACCNSQ